LNGLRRKLLRALKEKAERRDDLFRQFLAKLKDAFPDSTIILFGSRARQTHLPYSDYDVALILPEKHCTDKFEVLNQARRLKPPGFSLDLIVICEGELEDPLVKSMLNNAKVLYNGLNHDESGGYTELRGD